MSEADSKPVEAEANPIDVDPSQEPVTSVPNSPSLFSNPLVLILLGATIGVAVAFYLRPHWHLIDNLDIGLSAFESSGATEIEPPHDSYYDLETNESCPLFYPEVLEPSLPAKFQKADLEYKLGEVVTAGPNGTLLRRLVNLQTTLSRDALFEDVMQPAIFVINSAEESLRSFVEDFDGRVTIVRVPRKAGYGGADGGKLSQIALILTMERLGWPFVCVFEDDARPARGWFLFDRIMSLARELYGKLGFVSLALPGSVLDTQPSLLIPGSFYAARGALDTAGVIWGRLSIGPAHRYLEALADALNPDTLPLGNGIATFAARPNEPSLDVLTWLPAKPILRRLVSPEGHNDSAVVAQMAAVLARSKTGVFEWHDLYQWYPVPSLEPA